MREAHNNTDESNRFCYCAIGQNHGNLPAEIREAILRHILQCLDVVLISDVSYTLIRPAQPVLTPRLVKILREFGFQLDRYNYRYAGDPGGRGIRLYAGAFGGH